MRKTTFFAVCASLTLISTIAQVSMARQARGKSAKTQEQKASTEQAATEKAAEKAAKAKASALLMGADKHAQIEDYAAAERLILEAMTTAANDSEIREAVDLKWKEVLNKANGKTQSKHLSQLEEAERLLSEGKFDKASETVQGVRKETNDPVVIRKVQEVSDKIHPYRFGLFNIGQQRVYAMGGWVIDVSLVILFLMLGYLLVRLLTQAWALSHRNKWLILEIIDGSGQGIGERVIDSLRRLSVEKRSSVSAGLLALERPQFPSVVHLQFAQVEVDPAPAIDALNLQIGTVNVGAFAKALLVFNKWINARRSHITGRVVTSGTQVTVHLTRRNADGKSSLVSASCDGAGGVDAGVIAANAASYKMYYLIAREQTQKDVDTARLGAEAEAVEKMRQGLEQLRRYIYEQYSEGPQMAYEIFSHIRGEQPTLAIAYLYEGIALDLMERHDEAISRFNYLGHLTSDDQLKAKAIYNKGISLFRKYTSQDLVDAIKVLSGLIRVERNLVGNPIRALAFAAKANATAHRPIFWQEAIFGDRSRDDSVIRKRKEKGKRWIDKQVTRVEGMIRKLKEVHKDSGEGETWDDISRGQLNWAIFNARGNIYLNCAINFFVPPYLDDEEEPKKHNEYLEKARAALQQCQLILPPGVETLTNLATVLLFLSRTADARAYAEAAIKLNPDYEYAYYRKAQSWDQENRPDKVLEVLKDFAKDRSPRIRSFKELYGKYSVELART
jgi:tetratricopeptide (TPR) repeat protein